MENVRVSHPIKVVSACGEQMRLLGFCQERPQGSLPSPMLDALWTALLFACVSSIVVILGSAFGHFYLESHGGRITQDRDFVHTFATWDGGHYIRIAEEGYSYDPTKRSNVVFFPAYPLAGRFIAAVTGLRIDLSLVIVSYIFLIASFVAGILYVDRFKHQTPLRLPGNQSGGGENERFSPATYVLLALAFFPTTFYFRMAYSESIFLFELIVILYGMNKKWPLWALGAVIGLATATRPTGVALVVPFLWCIWERSQDWKVFIARSLIFVTVACWGLLSFMGFLWYSFGDPFAFAKSHMYWYERPVVSIVEQLWLGLTLEPFFCIYDPLCECFKRHNHADPSAIFSMYFANPLYFALFAALVAFGAIKGWLSKEEVLASSALLLFSYLSKGYAICMCGQARYASVVFPVYLVLGNLLERLPGPILALFVGVCGFFLGIYSALFVSWYFFY